MLYSIALDQKNKLKKHANSLSYEADLAVLYILKGRKLEYIICFQFYL